MAVGYYQCWLLRLSLLVIVGAVPALPNAIAPTKVVAQSTPNSETLNTSKEQANRLLQQGIRQYETAEYDAALNFLQQALMMYRQLSDRHGEIQVLSTLSEVHTELQNNDKAVELGQQALTLSQEVGFLLLEGRALAALGRALFQSDQDQQAQQVTEESLNMAREMGDRLGEGQALINLSGIYNFTLKQPEAAVELAQKAVSIAREMGDRRTEGRAFLRVAQALEEQNQPTQAIAAYEQGLEAAKAAGDRRNMGLLLLNIGWSYNILEAYDKAIPYLQQGVELTEALPLLPLRFQITYQLGAAHLGLKQYEQALQVYQQAIVIAQESNNLNQQYSAWFDLAATYSRADDLTNAVKARQEALKVAQQLNEPKILAEAYQKLGSTSGVSGDFQVAVKHYQQAIELYRQEKDPQGEVDTLILLIENYTNLKEYKEAIALSQQALQLVRALPDPSREYNLWSSLAATYSTADDLTNAVKARQEALKVAQQLNEPKILAEAYRKLGSASSLSGDSQVAVKHFQQAIELYRQEKDPQGEVDTLILLIENYMDLKEYKEAIALSQQALQLVRALPDPSREYTLWSNLAATYSRADDLTNAVKAREEALKVAQQLNEPIKLAEAYRKLGAAHGSENYQEALKHFQQAIELYRQEKDPQGEVDMLILMTEALSNLKKYERAIEIGQQALQQANSLPDASKTTASALDELSDSYINLGDQYGKDEKYAKALETFQQVQELGKQYRRSDLEVRALNYIGWNYRRQQDYDKAIALLQQGLTLAQETEDHEQEMDILLNLRAVYSLRREYVKALDLTERAWHVVQEQINRSDNEDDRLQWRRREGRAVLPRLVFVHQLLKNYPKAIEVAHLTLKNAQERNDFEDIATASSNVLDTYSNVQEYSEGIAFAQSFLKQAEQRGDKKFIAQAQGVVGDAYYKAKDYPNAIATYERSLVITQEIEDYTRQILLLNVLSEAYINTGEFDKTIDLAQQALELIPKTKNSGFEIFTRANLGRAYGGLEDYPKAIEQLQAGLAIAEKTYNLNQQARLWMLLSAVYGSTKEFPKLFEALNQTQAIAQKDSNAFFDSASRLLHSSACLQLGSPNCGQEGSQEISTAEIASLGDTELLTVFQLFVESFATFTEGNYSQSLTLAQKILPLAQTQKDPNFISSIYQLMAINYAELGDAQQAISNAENGVEIAKTTKDKSLHSSAFGTLGEVYRKFGQTDKAIEAYQGAIAAKSEDAAGAYTGLARIYRETQPSLAIAFYKQAVSQIEGIRQKNRALPSDLQASFLQTVQGLGQTKVADTYRELADLLLKSDRVLEAQQVLDLLKVKELDDYLRNVRGTGQHLVILRPEEEILQKYSELQKTAIELGQEFNQLQDKIRSGQELSPKENERLTQLHQLQKELVEQFNQFALRPDIAQLIQQLNHTDSPDTVQFETFNSLRNDLKELNAVLIYPLVLDDRLELIITTPDAPPLRRPVNVKREELNRVIAEFRSALENRSNDIQVPAQQLYTWLIKPIENDLKQANPQTILYAPDAQLRYIPLAALHDGQQWMIQRYAVNNITLQSLTEYRTQPPSDPRILAGAFADTGLNYPVVVGDRTLNFRGLPFAGKEVANLTAAMPNTASFFDQSFNLATLEPRMNAYNILHFATHAAFVPEQPEKSFILFGDGTPANLRDIGSWTLTNVDLVVLSACETGVGMNALGNAALQSNGIEILGLGYQFQKAGAKAAIASLWQVDDGGTQALMVEFYNALQNGTTKVEALRQAQIALIGGDFSTVGEKRSDIEVRSLEGVSPQVIDRLNHPYYWAPFILIGNGL